MSYHSSSSYIQQLDRVQRHFTKLTKVQSKKRGHDALASNEKRLKMLNINSVEGIQWQICISGDEVEIHIILQTLFWFATGTDRKQL